MKQSERKSGGDISIEPLYMVDTQENTLTAEGTATMKVSREKTKTETSLMPLVYMWCAQTSDPAMAMAIDEATMAL